MLQHVENIANFVNEPFSDSSIIPTFIVSKLAASKVRLYYLEMVVMKYLWDIIVIFLQKNF